MSLRSALPWLTATAVLVAVAHWGHRPDAPGRVYFEPRGADPALVESERRAGRTPMCWSPHSDLCRVKRLGVAAAGTSGS